MVNNLLGRYFATLTGVVLVVLPLTFSCIAEKAERDFTNDTQFAALAATVKELSQKVSIHAQDVRQDVGTQVQQGLVNKTIIDNATYDKWAFRIAIILLGVGTLAYPFGKSLWIVGKWILPRRRIHGKNK